MTGQRIAHQHARLAALNARCVAIIASERGRSVIDAIHGNSGDRDSMRYGRLFLMSSPARIKGNTLIHRVSKESSDWIALVRS